MRRIRYQVACSLDGFIAGPGGDFDWITRDPDVDFGALFAQFDTLLMGRRTYDVIRSMGLNFPGKRVVVVSRTLQQEEHPDVLVLSGDIERRITALRDEEGLDIWLYGGGELFSALLGMDLVDSVEPAIIPILLGGGVPFLPSPAVRRGLTLTGHRIYRSGIVLLEYSVSASGA
jgi:dihydrofolate reductase